MKVEQMSLLYRSIVNYNSNLVGDGKTVTVVEADEFDRSFCICTILLALRQWMRTI
jgi:hypothetical protein